jgi:polar amino acid transport system substrate-binding protein
MIVIGILRLLLSFPLLVCVFDAHAQETVKPARLLVGTMRVPPFVLRSDDGQWSGLSIDLWKRIAAEMKTEFEFREYDYDAAAMLQAVERRQLDLAIAAIPLNLEGESRSISRTPISPLLWRSPCAQSPSPARCRQSARC